jgi:hypothetical protein
MYFHTDNPYTVGRIADSLARAKEQGQRIRFDVTPNGQLRYKIGGGVWSAPISSTPDPWRDQR